MNSCRSEIIALYLPGRIKRTEQGDFTTGSHLQIERISGFPGMIQSIDLLTCSCVRINHALCGLSRLHLLLLDVLA